MTISATRIIAPLVFVVLAWVVAHPAIAKASYTGVLDGALGTTFYRDADGDGFGDPFTTVVSDTAPSGYVNVAGDCDDSDPLVPSVNPCKALIAASTVTGGSSSQEAQAARALGYQATVATDATWASMSQAQFGEYRMLIIGDPTCTGSISSTILGSSGIWAPVVMGNAGGRTLAGNRILIGTDPVFHDGGTVSSARATIIRDGITFASKQPGRTGLYFDATCSGGGGAVLTALQQLSAGSSTWTNNSVPPCGGSVSLVASESSFADLTTASLQGWGCSVHETWPTFPTDWNALAVATDTPSHPTCGVDPNTGLSACGEAYILIAGSSVIVASGSISISPLDSTTPARGTHTVTAHATSGGDTLPNQAITFTVTGQNAGVSGVCTPSGCFTDTNGDVSFTYTDVNGEGDDTIKASFIDGRGSLQAATAQMHWKGNALPVATGDSYAVNEDNTLTVSAATGVLANDTDANGDALTAVKVSDPTHGSLVLNSNGSFSYTPSANYNGGDTFTYQASDGIGSSDVVTVSINIAPVNDAPVLNALSNQTLLWGDALRFTATGSDPDLPADTFAFSLDPGAPAGATISSAGVFSWTPSDGQAGASTITIRVTDAGGLSDAKSFTATVNNHRTSAVIASTSVSPTVYGQPLALTATVRDLDRTTSPVGVVKFFDGPSFVGQASLASTGADQAQATLNNVLLPVGVAVTGEYTQHQLRAEYGQTSGYLASSSANLAFTITIAQTAAVVTSIAPNAPRAGQAMTFTARITALSPSPMAVSEGLVEFRAQSGRTSTVLGTAAVVNGAAVLTSSTLGAGNYTVTATYKGSGNYYGSQSAPFGFGVTK